MKIKTEKIRQLLQQIEDLLAAIQEAEQREQETLALIAKPYRKSARNFVHYRAFRRFDLRALQKQLRQLGLSRFANAEGHVKASLLNTRLVLQALIRDDGKRISKSGLSIKTARRRLKTHTKELLGYRSSGRRVRIMVTQPTEAAEQYAVADQMVQAGMNVARVNCAHDSPEVWLKIIKNVRTAAKKAGRNIKIAMDLAGPKIRTGEIAPGPEVRKFKPQKNQLGQLTQPATILLLPELGANSPANALPLGDLALQQLQVGDQLRLRDARGKKRKLQITERNTEGRLLATCNKTAFITTGTVLNLIGEQEHVFAVGNLPAVEQYLLLRKGDTLRVDKEDIPGAAAVRNSAGKVVSEAHISCQLKAVFDRVETGDAILFDDGKIAGKITATASHYFRVLITQAPTQGAKLRAEKGINFPTTEMGISGLTAKDKEDLKFVAQYADIVNFSFVNSKADVEELFSRLEELKVFNKLGVILKIETRRAYNNLSEILMSAMRSQQVGVMIARGDLAVETGWDNIGLVQEEILALCSAAHLPVVWATQVLEGLAKKGLPSRSEITDATTSLRAECVMLNKGNYIKEAISLLDVILKHMEQYHDKKEVMLPRREKLSL